MPHTSEDILRLAAEQQVAFISLQFTDLIGQVKHVTIPAERLAECLDHGVWFDGSSIEGLDRVRIAESDMYLVPDLDSYAVIPWDQTDGMLTARLICDVYTPDGQPFAADPRAVLRRAVAEAAELGYRYTLAPEIEFFLFRSGPDGEPSLMPHDRAGYFDVSTDASNHVRQQVIRALGSFGIGVESSHHEVAISQHEIDLTHGDALRTADNVVTFRTTLKAIAQQNNLYATLMPKPLADVDGSGLHLHQSLIDMATGRNLFYDANDPYNLSPLARHFIAGLLAHSRAMIAVLAPLVNSYKRLVPGYEAPVYLTWGRTNRSALVRVPRVSPTRPESTRIELRCADPSCNPYLAFAVMLRAGLDGIRRELPLPEAAEEDLFHVDPRAFQLDMLPPSLGQALAELRTNDVVKAALGPHVVERFLDAKTQEWDSYRTRVSQWELDRYLRQF